jgi:hypothetical protein
MFLPARQVFVGCHGILVIVCNIAECLFIVIFDRHLFTSPILLLCTCSTRGLREPSFLGRRCVRDLTFRVCAGCALSFGFRGRAGGGSTTLFVPIVIDDVCRSATWVQGLFSRYSSKYRRSVRLTSLAPESNCCVLDRNQPMR